jgi:hypothetical protein
LKYLTNWIREDYFEEVKVRTSVAIDSDQQNVKDLEIFNSRADELNKEALDVLDYQVAL